MIKKTESNIKKTCNYRNKLTNTKICIESDNGSDNESDNESEKNSEDSEDDTTNNEGETNIIDEKFSDYKTDLISKYIVRDKVTNFNSKSILCYYLWSGIKYLDKWELNRKINEQHWKKIENQMVKDYKKSGEFIFYEPIHLAIKKNSIFYVIDGQHRLLACNELYKKNTYPINQIPCVIWFPKTEEEFIEIFDKINSRTPLDRTKLFNYKINEIIELMDKTWNKTESIWGKTRPKINKGIFIDKMRESDSVQILESNEIIKKIKQINSKIRGLSRNKRCDKYLADSIHNHSESMDFFLGYDKKLGWIDYIL